MTTSTSTGWLERPVSIESIKESMDKMNYLHMESLRKMFGIRFIVDTFDSIVAPDEFVLVIGTKLHAKLQQHIKDNPVPLHVQETLNSVT